MAERDQTRFGRDPGTTGAGSDTGGGRQMGRFYTGATSRRQMGRPYGDSQRGGRGDGEYGRRTSWREYEAQPLPGADPGLRERYEEPLGEPSERRSSGASREQQGQRLDPGFRESRRENRVNEEYRGRRSAAEFGGRDWDREEGRFERETTNRSRRWQREPAMAADIMTRHPKTVTPENSVCDIAALMKSEDTGIIPVVDGSCTLQGVVTDRDIVVRCLAERKQAESCAAGDVMSTDVEAVTPDEPLSEVIEIMAKSQIRRVPVVDRNDRLLGIISMADIANRADYDEDLQDALESISARRSFWSRLWT